MFTISRLLTLIALLSISHLSCAHAELEKAKYLAALQEEVFDTIPDEKTMLKAKQNESSQTRVGKLGPKHLTQELFLDYMQQKYPASYRILEKLPTQFKDQLFVNYQAHLDINKTRQEMMNLSRKP